MNVYFFVGVVFVLTALYGSVVSILQEFSIIPRGSWGVPFISSTLLMVIGLLPWGVTLLFSGSIPDFVAIPLILCGSVIFIAGLRLDSIKRRGQSATT